jgi:formyl-CoA transferase
MDQGPRQGEAALPPNVGEHSDEVLREVGYSDAEIRALRAEGVIA